ncbi:hypothetical protein PSCICJ_32450 [Pseudomonas cichorii]|nr:hypothetical protein PSCICJ_32450 [Pseudomonas cichorii]
MHEQAAVTAHLLLGGRVVSFFETTELPMNILSTEQENVLEKSLRLAANETAYPPSVCFR